MKTPSKTLAGLFSLDHNIRLYIPSTTAVSHDGTALQEAFITRTLSAFSDWFGGSTAFDALGAWKSQAEGLVTERVKIVESYATKEQVESSLPAVIALANQIKKEMGQEAVSLEYDNKLYFI